MFREVWPSIRPLIFAGWVVASLRFGIELARLDDLTAFSFGIYGSLVGIIAFAGFHGVFDHLLWKKWMVASLMVGVLAVGLPNCITYSTANVLEWNSGRFHYDTEWRDLKASFMKEESLSEAAAAEAATKQLGHSDKTRVPAKAPDDTVGQVLQGCMVGGITSLVGTVFTFILGAIFIGIGRKMR